jgi:NAD(P)-dependent dehydrogenase (short-subunit alcohol dehydrogenase family)
MTSAQDKRVLVIGGETAVGRALTIGLAEAGVDVAIASLSKDTKAEFAINSALNELWALGRRGVALAIDATDAAQVREALERAERELDTLDAVVAVGDTIAREALEGRRVIEVAADADASEVVRMILERRNDGGQS